MGRASSRRRKDDGARDELRYRRKVVRVTRRRRDRAQRRSEARGWELEDLTPSRFRTDLSFKRVRPKPRWAVRFAAAALALALVAGLVIAGARILPKTLFADMRARSDAQVAIEALRSGDLPDLEKQLAAHRGGHAFAYYFTLQVTPRDLGDALATVASPTGNATLTSSTDPRLYDIELTDLAGTLALATHGTGDRALPSSWTDDFATATTTPEALYAPSRVFGPDAKKRLDQDVANRQNLLLLLARGYWSTEFLEAVTAAYWEYDHTEGSDAWPGTELDDAKYAPAPNGKYLTDGILALTAALTANPEAAAWAFTGFQPGTEPLNFDGRDHAAGKFTHYLFFEHSFPGGSGDGSVGMTASLTALSSAIDETSAAAPASASESGGPMADSLVLQALAKAKDASGCSWNPLDYGHCVVAAVEVLWHWVEKWGHSVLDILALTTFAPPPFDALGIGAAATNATWYAIDGDYANAGLSLASAVPGLAFTKLAKGIGGGVEAEQIATQADDVAKAANEMRAAVGTESRATRLVTAEDVKNRPNLWATTKAQVLERAPKTRAGFIDPNTGKVLVEGEYDFGHKPGYEWRCMKAKALAQQWTWQQLANNYNDPSHLQIEDRTSNRSHKYESDVCAI